MNRFKENFIPICEIVGMIVAFFFPMIINLGVHFHQYLNENYITPANIIYYLAIKGGNILIGIFLVFIVTWRIRKHNNNILFNRDNVYHNYPYIWYFICAKVLNIRKCNLVNVPIYMQFKLVVRKTFDHYPLEDQDYPEMENEEIVTEYFNKGRMTNCIEYNLVLEDTYPISTAQLPCKKQDLYTISISRNDRTTVGRHFSQKFIDSVINETRKLPAEITLNVYTTTNPKNTMNIARRAFTMADRGNISHVYVFQQRCDGVRLFEDKGKKLY